MNKKEIGARIRKARKDAGITSTQLLADLLAAAITKTGASKTTKSGNGEGLTRQTVDNWETGKIIPPWDRIMLLAELFADRLGAEFGEEWILFGEKRAAQIQAEKRYLASIDSREGDLLTLFRSMDPDRQATLLEMAKTFAKDHPAPVASIYQMKRKDSKN